MSKPDLRFFCKLSRKLRANTCLERESKQYPERKAERAQGKGAATSFPHAKGSGPERSPSALPWDCSALVDRPDALVTF